MAVLAKIKQDPMTLSLLKFWYARADFSESAEVAAFQQECAIKPTGK
jgi:hypothetical protein